MMYAKTFRLPYLSPAQFFVKVTSPPASRLAHLLRESCWQIGDFYLLCQYQHLFVELYCFQGCRSRT
jgi:hypothetical protein